MAELPQPASYTSAPVRNHLRVHLEAPVEDVWLLVGDHVRLPEYSAGIEAVSLSADGGTRTCRFRATDGTPALELSEQIRCELPGVGYYTSAAEPNAFGLTDDLSVVTVSSDGTGTAFEWTQYFNSGDLAVAIRSFDEGLADMAKQLVSRFGGQVTTRWAQDTNDPTRA